MHEQKQNPDLAGQVAVITGAGRGIGRAIAVAYGEHGAAVVCAARSDDQISAVADDIRARSGQALAQVCDVSNSAQIEALYSAASETFGGIDIVVINAGISGERVAIAASDPTKWRRVIEINLIAAASPGSEWLKLPGDVAPLALFLAGLPNHGPSGQSFNLMGRDP